MTERIHLIPLNDSVEHIRSVDCSCSPMRDVEEENLIIHTAFDGREVDKEVATRLVQIH